MAVPSISGLTLLTTFNNQAPTGSVPSGVTAAATLLGSSNSSETRNNTVNAKVGSTSTVTSTNIPVGSFLVGKMQIGGTGAPVLDTWLAILSNTSNYIEYKVEIGYQSQIASAIYAAYVFDLTAGMNSNAVQVGTLDRSAITRLGIWWNQSSTATTIFRLQHFYYGTAVIATAGDSGTSITFDSFITYLDTLFVSGYSSFTQNGYISNKFFNLPLQIGNGSALTYCVTSSVEVINFQIVARDATYSATYKFFRNQVSDNFLGIEFFLGSSDTVQLKNKTFTSQSPIKFLVNASSSTLAILSLDSCSVVNAGLITLRSPFIGVSISFINCKEVTLNNATLRNSSISGSTGVYAVLGSTTATVTSCTISNSSRGLQIISAADYSNLQFAISGQVRGVNISTGVTNGQTVNLSKCTFSGNTTDIYWEGTSGSITVIVTTSGITTSTAGGTINLVVSTTIIATNLIIGSTVGLFNNSGALVESGIASGTSYTFSTLNYPGAVNYTIRVRLYGYQPYTGIIQLAIGTVSNFISQLVNPFTILSSASAAALTGITVNYSTSLISLSNSTTISNVYDFCHSSFALLANIDKTTLPIDTADGLIRSLLFDLTVQTGVVISGSGSFAVGARKLTLVDARTYNFAASIGATGQIILSNGITTLPLFTFISGSKINNSTAINAVAQLIYAQLANTSASSPTIGTGIVTIQSIPVTFIGFPTTANINGLSPSSTFAIQDVTGNTWTTYDASSGSVSLSLSTIATGSNLVLRADAKGWYRTADITIAVSYFGSFDFSNLFSAITDQDGIAIAGLGITSEKNRVSYNQSVGRFELDSGVISFNSLLDKKEEITSSQAGLTMFNSALIRQMIFAKNAYSKVIQLPSPLMVSATITAATSPVLTDVVLIRTGDPTADVFLHDLTSTASGLTNRPEVRTLLTKFISDTGSSGSGGSTLTEAQIRSAVGLASANLDTQLASKPTTTELNARTLVSSNYALESTGQAIKTKTDLFNFTGANVQAVISQVFPTNFASLAISGTGATTVGTNNDKSNYSLSGTQTFNLTGNISGNITGSVNSVTTAITLPNIPTNWITAAGINTGAITATKFSTDAIDSNVLASSAVNEIQSGLSTYNGADTSGVTTLLNRISAALPTLTQIEASTVLAKQSTLLLIPTNPLLSSSYLAPDNTGISAIKAKTDLLGFTGGNINSEAKVISDKVGYSLTTTSINDIRTGLSTYDGSDTTGTATLLTRLTNGRASNLDNLNATVSSRAMPSDLIVNVSGGFTTQDRIQLENIPTNPLLANNYVAPDNTNILSIKAQTDKLVFTGTTLNVTAKTVEDKSGYSLATSFPSIPSASDISTVVWSNANTRTLSSGANIVLAKGVGITGFNDITTGNIRTELAIELGRITLDLSSLARPSDVNVTVSGQFSNDDRAKLNTIKESTDTARKFVTNRYKIDATANTGTLYDDDGVTVEVVHNLKDDSGQPVSSNVYERLP